MRTLTREQWEEPGYRIAEHTNSPPVRPDDLLYTVNHYPAQAVISPTDPVAWFQATQRAYVRTRGYSIGYSWGYWPDGLEVELRGWEYRNAANDAPAPGDENRGSVSFLLVVPGLGDAGQPATAAQIAAVRNRLIDVHERAGRALPNIVHGDLEPTACAGAGVNHQTRTGVFLPVAPPPPQPEETDMILIRVNGAGSYAVFAETPGGVLRWISNGHEHDAWKATGAPEAMIPAGEFATIVDYARTAGGISAEVTRITGITTERWYGRAIG